MLNLFRSQSRSAAGAITYVTIGTLMMIWAGLWYDYFLMPVPNPPAWQMFACVGTILSGFAIAAIGLLIGRGAKAANTTVGVASAGPVAHNVLSAPSSLRAADSMGNPVVTPVPANMTPVNHAGRKLPALRYIDTCRAPGARIMTAKVKQP